MARVFFSLLLLQFELSGCALLPRAGHWLKAASAGAGRCTYPNPQPPQERLSRLFSPCCYCSMYSRCCAIGEYIATVSEQRLGKHFPAETNTHVTIYLLWKLGVFSVVCAGMLRARQFEANSSRQGTYKQGCHKVLSCPSHCTVYI
jgi:hypothetical protein